MDPFTNKLLQNIRYKLTPAFKLGLSIEQKGL